jgi:hypothetical protein
MKTKEEIEQLATQDFNDRQECGHYELADLKSRDYYCDGFSNGYTQCQEDMADKVFTLDDVKKIINLAYVSGGGGDTYQECNDFISEQMDITLNKQD